MILHRPQFRSNMMYSLILVDEKIFCCHGGLSPDLQSMEQIRRIMRPTDVPDQGLLCDLLWSDPDKDTMGWGENDRGVSFTFGAEVRVGKEWKLDNRLKTICVHLQIVGKFLQKHDFDLICRAHQVVEDGYEFFAKRQLVTLFSAPNYCGEFDNAGELILRWWLKQADDIQAAITSMSLTCVLYDCFCAHLTW